MGEMAGMTSVRIGKQSNFRPKTAKVLGRDGEEAVFNYERAPVMILGDGQAMRNRVTNWEYNLAQTHNLVPCTIDIIKSIAGTEGFATFLCNFNQRPETFSNCNVRTKFNKNQGPSIFPYGVPFNFQPISMFVLHSPL